MKVSIPSDLWEYILMDNDLEKYQRCLGTNRFFRNPSSILRSVKVLKVVKAPRRSFGVSVDG